MEKLRDHLLVKPALAVLSVLLLVLAWLPGSALADEPVELGLDIGHTSRRVGDPLDTNDAGGDGSGDDVHDNSGDKDKGPGLLDLIMRSNHVLIIPQYVGGTLSFTYIILSDSVRVVEGRYAK